MAEARARPIDGLAAGAPTQNRLPTGLGEIIADRLRERILSGEITERLPPQEDLLEHFTASLPSLRSGLQILETEGLITIRRGRFGGADVHLPTSASVAYTTALVLQSRQTKIADVSEALRLLLPTAASLCAERPDRMEQVVPALEDIQARHEQSLADVVEFNRLAQQFHGEIVDRCGNASISVVVGALEVVWGAHEAEVARVEAESSTVTTTEGLRRSLRDHRKIIDAISAGDATATARIASRHVEVFSDYGVGPQTVEAGLLRNPHRAQYEPRRRRRPG
jgi:GntR family transcriptional repressor for pyruvate dehydrogenase complex